MYVSLIEFTFLYVPGMYDMAGERKLNGSPFGNKDYYYLCQEGYVFCLVG